MRREDFHGKVLLVVIGLFQIPLFGFRQKILPRASIEENHVEEKSFIVVHRSSSFRFVWRPENRMIQLRRNKTRRVPLNEATLPFRRQDELSSEMILVISQNLLH